MLHPPQIIPVSSNISKCLHSTRAHVALHETIIRSKNQSTNVRVISKLNVFIAISSESCKDFHVLFMLRPPKIITASSNLSNCLHLTRIHGGLH